jgi:hypothetical protein
VFRGYIILFSIQDQLSYRKKEKRKAIVSRSMHSVISYQVHIFHTAFKMTRSAKNAFEIMMKSDSKVKKDSRPLLFSSNCPIRIGTSGYSYKRFVDIFELFYLYLHIQLAYGSK